MRASMLLHRTFIAIAVLLTGLSPSAAMDAGAEAEREARDYRARVQQAADVVIVPKLLQALSKEELKRLGIFRVDVAASRDSLGLRLDSLAGEETRLVVSIGHMFVHDILIEASVMWPMAGTDEQLLSYATEVTRFALSARDPASTVREPELFWRVLGWSDKKYESLQTNPKYAQYLARSRMRTFAWIVARAIAIRLSNHAPPTLTTQSAEGEARVLASTAQLLMRAHFSPVPALGSSIFFYGVQHRGQDSRAWRCSAKQVYDAAIVVTEQDLKSASEAFAATLATATRDWRATRDLLDRHGECTGA